MSLDKITQDYVNQYKLKGITPEWLTLLTKTVNSRNISTVDWNIAMDDIRKVASDSAATHNFIKAFNEEFNEYYKRNIKSIHYTTDSEDKLSNTVLDSLTLTPDNKLKNDKVKFSVDTLETYKHGGNVEEVLYCSGLNDGTQDVGFVMNFKESTYVENIQLYVRSVAASVNIKICASADGNTYTEDNTHNVYLQSFGNSVDVYLIPVGMYVNTIKIIQPSGEGYTEGRFSICGIEMYKSNLTGVWVLTKYDGSKLTIPMVDPADFAKQIQKYVDQASDSKNKALSSEENASKSETNASISETNAKISEGNAATSESNALESASDAAKALAAVNKTIADATSETNVANKLVRLNSSGKIPSQFIPTERLVEMFQIQNENDLTNPLYTGTARKGDLAYLVQSVYDDTGNVTVNLLVKTWRLFLDTPTDKTAWILQTTSYADQSTFSKYSEQSDNTTRVNGVLVRFGNINTYNSADKEGLYIITDYSESEA